VPGISAHVSVRDEYRPSFFTLMAASDTSNRRTCPFPAAIPNRQSCTQSNDEIVARHTPTRRAAWQDIGVSKAITTCHSGQNKALR